MRSAPTTERATWWRTPALRSAVTRFVVEVVKNSITARSSNEGEFETSTTTEAPSSTSGSPSPVSVLTPELGDAATASSSSARRQATTFEPIRPVPPMTTILMGVPEAKSPSGGNLPGLDGDVVSERFELSDEAFGDAVGVLAGVVIGAEVAVELTGLEHVPGGGEDRVADGGHGLGVAAAAA